MDHQERERERQVLILETNVTWCPVLAPASLWLWPSLLNTQLSLHFPRRMSMLEL